MAEDSVAQASTSETVPRSRLRIRDVLGCWKSKELYADLAEVCSCRVPWWVWGIAVEQFDDAGWRPLARCEADGRVQACSSASADSGESGALVIGENRMWVSLQEALGAVGASVKPLALKIDREEPLKTLLPKFKPYEVSQLSLLVFVLGFAWSLQAEASRRVVMVPLLAAIPACRICPEMVCLLRPGTFGGGNARKALACLAVFLLAIASSFLFFDLARRVFGPGSGRQMPPPMVVPLAREAASTVPARSCAVLPGKDCNSALAEWAGSDDCALLAETDGTCSDFCAAHGRTCIRAMGDGGTGACELLVGAHDLQTSADNGCLQDWSTQICVCSGHVPATTTPTPPPPEQAETSTPDLVGSEAEELPPVQGDVAMDWPRAIPPCFLEDAAYEPLDMPGERRTHARFPSECQWRCTRTPGCAHFTWFQDGGCHVQEFNAKLRPSSSASVAGPADCNDEEELQELLGHRAPSRRPEHVDTQTPAPERHEPRRIPEAQKEMSAQTTTAEPARREFEEADTRASRQWPSVEELEGSDDEEEEVQQERELVGEGSPWVVAAIFAAFVVVAFSTSS